MYPVVVCVQAWVVGGAATAWLEFSVQAETAAVRVCWPWRDLCRRHLQRLPGVNIRPFQETGLLDLCQVIEQW